MTLTHTPAQKRKASSRWAVRTVVVRLSRKLTATYRIRSGRMFSRLLAAMLAGFANLAAALPAGVEVVAGQATVSTSTANNMLIQQGSDKAILNWQSFGIGAGQSVQFVQPGAASVALNRVTGANPSAIYGSLSANGQVFLINPSGVMFAPGAQVNVGGLVASSLAISNDDFVAGRYTFSGNGGSVVNHGSINTARGGYVLLAAPSVSNTGSITTNGGSTGLVAGSRVSLDTSGAGLVRFSVDAAAVDAIAANSGVITAQGGQVAVLASALGNAMATVVNQTGVIRATSATERNGMIVLSGGRSGVVRVAGSLDASGGAAGQTGGTVKVLGDKVVLASAASIDASGAAGGGTVLVGGNYQGKGPEQNAAVTLVSSGATIDASATRSGDGGKVVVWADGATGFYGAIKATGGAEAGNGGFAEVSGKQTLAFDGAVNLSAPRGNAGTLLLDPLNIIVGAAGPAVYSDVSTFAAQAGTTQTVSTATLNGVAGNITLQATNDITLSTAFAVAAGKSVTFEANNDINITAANTLTTSGGGAITLKADADGLGGGNLALGAALASGGGAITLSGANITGTAAGTITTTGAGNGNAGAVSITGTGVVNLAGTITASGGTAGAGLTGRSGGVVTVSGAGGVTTAAITANGSNGGTGNTNGGNAGTIDVSNSTSGNIQTAALTASTGNAVGTGVGGTAGSISVSNTATTGNVITTALSTTGGAGGNGGAVTLSSQGGVTTTTIGTSGTVLAAGTRAGSNAGSITITGVNRSVGAITASGSAANGTDQAGGAAGVVSITGAGTLTTGTITASAGAATGAGAGGTAGSITLTGSDVTVSTLTTTGGAKGAGGSISVSAAGAGVLSTGGAAIASTGGAGINSAGANAGNITLSGGTVTLGASTLTATGGAGNGTSFAGGSGGEIRVTSNTGGMSSTGAGGMTANGGAASGTGAAGGAAGTISVINAAASTGTISLAGSVGLTARTGASTGTTAALAAGSITVNNNSAAATATTLAALNTSGQANGHGGTVSISTTGTLGASTIATGGGTVNALSTLDGRDAGNVTINTGGAITALGAITASGSAGVGANQNGGTGGTVAITSTGGNVAAGAITTSGGNAVAGVASGGNAGTITLDAAGGTPTITLAGNLSAVGGNQFGGGTSGSGANIRVKQDTLLNAATVTMDSRGGNAGVGTGGNIQFDGAINSTGGARALVLTGGTGDVTVSGAMGATSALSALTVTGNDITVASIGGASAGVTGATVLTATTANADVGELTLNGSVNVNALTLNAAASISAANAVKATSLTATLTGAASALTLSNSGNQITTLNTITTPGGFTLNNGNNSVTLAGNITATNNAVAIDAGTGTYTQGNNVDVSAGTGPITITADAVTIGTTNTGNNAFITSGTLTLKAKTAGQAMSLGGASALDYLSATEIARFATGATGPIVIGDTASTGVMTIGGAINLAGKTLTLNAGSITDTGSQPITATNLTLNANGQIGTDGTNGIDVIATNLNVNTTNNGNAFVRSTAAVNFGVGSSGSNVAGTLDLTTTGAVTQTATTGNVIAGTLQVKTLANAGAAITLTNSDNNAGAVNLRARNLADGSNAAGAIQYTDTNGFDVAALATTGNASLSAGGIVTQSGAINAAGLALKGAGGAYTLRHASNAVTTLAANTGSIDYSQANALAVGTVAGVVGVDNTGVARIETTGAASDLTLDAVVKSAASGDAVVLKAGSANAAGVVTGGKFVNNAGTGAIDAANGRYLVYTGDPATTDEIVTGFSKRYNTAASFTPGGSANMFLYRIAPTLTITSDNATKTYGQVNPVFTGNSSGYIDGDTAASVGVTRTSAAVFNTPVTPSGVAITSGATNNENYTLVLSHGTLQIDKASISSVGGITANDKVVDGNTSATLNTGGAMYNGIVPGDVLTVSGVGNFDTPFVGANKLVLIRGLVLSGAAAANYTLIDNTAVTRAAINDLSSFTGALLPAVAPTPVVARVTPARMTVADANALLEQNPTASGGCREDADCLSVTTVREATDQAPGLVSVMVASAVTGFQFALPAGLAELIAASDEPVEVSTIGGRPLPDWLRYDAATQTFIARSPPPGALPLQIRVRVGGRSVILTIARAPESAPAQRGVLVQRMVSTEKPG